jgi:hypothetical protein
MFLDIISSSRFFERCSVLAFFTDAFFIPPLEAVTNFRLLEALMNSIFFFRTGSFVRTLSASIVYFPQPRYEQGPKRIIRPSYAGDERSMIILSEVQILGRGIHDFQDEIKDDGTDIFERDTDASNVGPGYDQAFGEAIMKTHTAPWHITVGLSKRRRWPCANRSLGCCERCYSRGFS